LPSGEGLHEGDVITVDGTSGTILRGAATLVPPQPEERVARLLAWCEERARTPVLDHVPPDFVRVRSVDDAANAGDRVLVDVPWGGADSAAKLREVVATLLEHVPPPRLALAMPEGLRGTNLRPPRGPWEAIVASPRSAWAARLLSARIAVGEAETEDEPTGPVARRAAMTRGD